MIAPLCFEVTSLHNVHFRQCIEMRQFQVHLASHSHQGRRNERRWINQKSRVDQVHTTNSVSKACSALKHQKQEKFFVNQQNLAGTERAG